MKFDDSQPTGVRGRLKLVEEISSKDYLFIDQVSAKGLALLSDKKSIKIEVLGMPSRVVFMASISEAIPGGLRLSLPRQITSIERRQNTRYQTTPNQMAYLKLNGWQPNPTDIASPLVIAPFEHLANWISIADVSAGGACVFTHFYGVIAALEQRENPVSGEIVLPMMAAIEVKFDVKWKKRTVNRLIEGGRELGRLEFRFGIEFAEMQENVELKIRQFMRQLSMAQAI